MVIKLIIKLIIKAVGVSHFIIAAVTLVVNVMRCAIWYHFYNLKKVKNTQGGVLILVKLQAEACNVTKINTSPWVFLTFLKLY